MAASRGINKTTPTFDAEERALRGKALRGVSTEEASVDDPPSKSRAGRKVRTRPSKNEFELKNSKGETLAVIDWDEGKVELLANVTMTEAALSFLEELAEAGQLKLNEKARQAVSDLLMEITARDTVIGRLTSAPIVAGAKMGKPE